MTITSYNLLIRYRKRTEAALNDINVQLARRTLIPKLVAIVKSYGDYEQQLSDNLHRLPVTPASYPDIKTNQHYLNLQQNLSEIETAIQAARRYYNGSVGNLNIRTGCFPDLIIARLLNFQPTDFFTLNSVQYDQ